jgi:hypothetical protein
LSEVRYFKGVWIPKEIWSNPDLTWMEKLFITEINSLDNDEGCYASNEYFSVFFGLTKQRCSQIINSLITKKYVSCEYVREGKLIKKRVLRILDTGIKNIYRGIKNTLGGYQENAKENNIIYNNTVNNTKRGGRFTPPTPAEVQAYLDTINCKSFTGQYFCDKNDSIGWTVGKNKAPMKDWRAAVRTWVKHIYDVPNKKLLETPESRAARSEEIRKITEGV